MRDAFKDESNIDEFETKVEIVYIKEELLPSFVKDDRCTLEDTFIEDTFTVEDTEIELQIFLT